PARVLLIARSAQGWQAVQAKLHKLRANVDTTAQRLDPLPDAGHIRERMFTTARDCFARAYPELEGAAPIAPPKSLGLPHFALTLTVHMAALVAVDAAAHGRDAPVDPLGLTVYLLNREHENWRQLYENAAGGLDFQTPDTVLARLVFIAALTGASDPEAAAELLNKALPGVPTEQAIRDHALCYPPTDPAGVNTLEPLLPDRLAEDFLALTLPGSPTADYSADDWAAGAVRILLPAAPTDKAPRFTPRALTFLAAAAARWSHVGRLHLFPLLDGNPAMVRDANSASITALGELTELPVELMRSIDEQFPDRRSDLDVGIAEFTRRRVQRQLAADPEPEPTVHARLWYDLAYREYVVGRFPDALPAAQRAVAIRERQGAGQEARLAESLNMLALVLSDLGRSAEALQYADRAVELSRRVADDDPAHAVNLARHLLNRGSHRHDLGQWADAVADTAEAADIRERLADGGPQATDEFADALHNLGRMLRDVGRRAEALERAEQATALYRELAEREPLVYRPKLAIGLTSVSSLLLALGRPDEVLKPAHEAAELSRALVKLNPVYESELAAALTNMSGAYTMLRQSAAACEAADEAVALYRALARANVGYLRLFADALDNLGGALLGTGRSDAALAAREESVTILRELAEENPEAHETSLADALNNVGTVLTDFNRPADALRYTEEAIAIHRRRTDHSVDANLATALQNRGLQLDLAGRHDEAVEPAQEAVALWRGLVERDSASHATGLANALTALGLLLGIASQPAAAEKLDEAAAIYRRLGEAYDPHLGRVLRSLGDVHTVLGQREALVITLGEAAEVHQRLADQDPAYRPIAFDLWTTLGGGRWRLEQHAAALTAARRAVDVGRTLAAQDPSLRPQLGPALQNLAVFLGLLGRRAEAVPFARERMDMVHDLTQADPEHFNPAALGMAQAQAVLRYLRDADEDADRDGMRAELLEASEIDRLLADELPAERAEEVRACWSAAAQTFAENGQTELASEIHRRFTRSADSAGSHHAAR
ncbi:tetratricopeptide repeat protein, partial [Actinocrinis sp.]|uniref:tetratricopeptide repeat protein n=1 Tax=Actinocrinis sp. TaxID=1920516 RepID=UPI002C71DD90